MWSMLGNAIGITFFWWLYIIPFIFKIFYWFFKLSALNIATWFKGWRPVAQKMADEYMLLGVATGKHTHDSAVAKERAWMKANAILVGGAIVNLYIGVFGSMWILNLLYS